MKTFARVHHFLLVLLLPLAAATAATTPIIDPALAQTKELIATSNLNTEGGVDLQITLDLARHQRDEHDYDQASKTLVSILNSDAPEHFKRSALLELALTTQQANQLARAIQIFGQYVTRCSDDPSVPEVLLREGLVYRQMGAHGMALSKFYAVMTTILNLKLDTSGYYQRLVLQAQTEIAETYYQQGNFDEAGGFFERLLKLDLSSLNKDEIRLKLIRCLAASAKHQEVVDNAKELLTSNPNTAEARFLLAISLQQLGHKDESLRQVVFLLDSPGAKTWKQAIGNQIANDFYAHGDYTNALVVYQHLADADSSPEWQVPALYQVGLVCERLHQVDQATTAYTRAIEDGSPLGEKADPNLRVVLDMAAWRKEYLAWQTRAAQANQTLRPPVATPPQVLVR
jgi:tetratricopeptide (TPR) repeat protein